MSTKTLLFSSGLLSLLGCSTDVVYSVKHGSPPPSCSTNTPALGYNTGFSRNIIIRKKPANDRGIAEFEIQTVDLGDKRYDLIYDKSWWFSDTFDFKTDKNGRLTSNNVKASSDLKDILSNVVSIAKAAGAAPLSSTEKKSPTECAPKANWTFTPDNPYFISKQSELCPGSYSDANPKQFIDDKDGIIVEIDCRYVSHDFDYKTSTYNGILVYDSQPVTLTIKESGQWIDKNKTPPLDKCSEKGQIISFSTEIACPSNLHAIPIKRNLLTSPETTISANGGFIEEYKITETGVIKGFFDTITTPLKSLMPKITTTDGKKSSTYESQ